MDNIIAKNLLENNVCSKCKFYNSQNSTCYRFESTEIEKSEDVEVFLNGNLQMENIGYTILNNKIEMLQHLFDYQVTMPTGYNDHNYVPQTNVNTVQIISRKIVDGKIVKTKKILKNKSIPESHTCEGFMDMNKVITNGS